MTGFAQQPGDISPHSAADFADVKQGEMASASNQNRIHEALRGSYGKNEYPAPDDSDNARQFFKLLEDCSGAYGPAYAMRTDRLGVENREVVELYWWDSMMSGAKAGYRSTMQQIDDEWVFEPGLCLVYCFSNGSISPGAPTTGTAGEAYAYEIGASDIDDGSLSASGLPDGLTMDVAGLITGTPTADGEFYAAITATADKTGPGTVTPGDKCTITRVAMITIIPAVEE